MINKTDEALLKYKWPVVYKKGVSEAWADLSASIAIACYDDILEGCRLIVDDTDLGIFPFAPVESEEDKDERVLDVNELCKLCCESKFGQGDENVYDVSVRKCLEIEGSRITVQGLSTSDVRRCALALFQEYSTQANVSAKLHKLMVYKEGGHFEQHVDSLHEHNHVATLVLIASFPHEGGELHVSDHTGKELAFSSSGKKPVRSICFYTDCPHRVMPMREGARVLLQYDVFLESTGNKHKNEDKNEPKSESESEVEEFEEQLDGDPFNNGFLDKDEEAADNKDLEHQMFNFTPQKLERLKKAVDKFLHAMESQKQNKDTQENEKQKKWWIGLLLKHRYSTASLTKDLLKSVDASVYEYLENSFNLKLVPIVIQAYEPYGQSMELTAAPLENSRSTSSWIDNDVDTITVVRSGSMGESRSVINISGTDSIEYTGNEAVEYDYRYFGALLAISRK
ncbi:hypothetical protein O6H91_18G072700 [Diphasiastrum complanatum]|uniref:Uncharacterized protein n=1 Tax=Diphasiastrum complanatum TaxID=34168 RepID=A0ACC2B3R3_DIPCM|nr:hypothetical protein O6H91_18G072700 [Diphasiastrum complanatum]